jgi:hypothetical protein
VHNSSACLSLVTEYQENCCALLRPGSLPLFKAICEREHCPASYLGQVTGDGRVVFQDSRDGSRPVDLPLSLVLADLPRKTFCTSRTSPCLYPLCFPPDTSLDDALDRVLRLPSVGSKRFLTSKVDRSVTGLIAQQQCVGPLHTPLADVGVIAHTHDNLTGAATGIGEQPSALTTHAKLDRIELTPRSHRYERSSLNPFADLYCLFSQGAALTCGDGASLRRGGCDQPRLRGRVRSGRHKMFRKLDVGCKTSGGRRGYVRETALSCIYIMWHMHMHICMYMLCMWS